MSGLGQRVREGRGEMVEGFKEASSSPAPLSRPPVPVRLLNEFAYCARLGYLMWVAGGAGLPPPRVESPKCPRCSRVGICLPDEVRFLCQAQGEETPPRALFPARDDALPLHVQHQGARVRKDG